MPHLFSPKEKIRLIRLKQVKKFWPFPKKNQNKTNPLEHPILKKVKKNTTQKGKKFPPK